jgi:tricorn protease interacting factor F2/3
MPERLLHIAQPETYDLHYSVDFEQFTFFCKQKVLLEITEQTSILCLHCEDLLISELQLSSENVVVPVTSDISDGKLNIYSGGMFSPGDYNLELRFSGKLNDDLSGFYRSRYIDNDGHEAYLATTQFEAPYARKAFPCFDEPAFKAVFTVTLDIPGQMIGISNMPVESECVANGRKSVRFLPTPPMSTYLLYMGAGNFDFIEQKRDDRTIRVYGVNGKSSQGRFALQFAADSLQFFEQYSGVKYPLPKLDLLAIPDFAAGAMENWGACTFREVLLYVDDATTSLTVKKRVAEVIAHELWHQWSGNLVTMKWWDDLWLNEAFATYQAYRAVDQFFPQWHILDDFIDGDTSAAFEMDMLSSTHPIAVPVHTANEIEEIFDHISYGKGGSVLRMIEGYIGEEAFRKGVSAYLDKFAYQNAIAEDLWETLEENSGLPVKDILISWVIKPGFPLLHAKKNDATIHLTQKLFTANKSESQELWPVPLTWTTDNHKGERLFDTKECEIAVNGSFTKINQGQTGFYRTLYDIRMYDELCNPIKSKQLHEYDRWGILNDLWACVIAGYASLDDLLQIVAWYDGEDQLFVLREIASQCTEISHLLRFTDHGKELFHRFRAPFSKALNNLGWKSTEKEEPHLKQLRPIAISFLIRSGDEVVKQQALSMARSYLENASLDPDIRGACLSAVSNDGTRQSFDTIKKAYEEKVNIEEKIALLCTLSEFTDPALLTQYINYAMTDAVRRQDLRTVFSRIAHNPSCPALFFNWVKENWERLRDLRKSHFVYMGLLQTLITTAPDINSLNNIRDFLNQNDEGYEKTKANAFEKAQLYISFRERGLTTSPSP